MAAIGSLMKTETVTARPNETVSHAAYIMTTNGVGSVLVVEGDALVGFLSERDVLQRVVAEGLDPTATLVSDVATPDPVTVEPTASLRECSQLMRAKEIRHLAVVREGRAVGIVSSRDLFAYVAASLERVVDDDVYTRAIATGDDPYDHVGGSYGR